ncbi:MAG: cupin domain-containing protein [Candidatus Latescibacterota bacterium]
MYRKLLSLTPAMLFLLVSAAFAQVQLDPKPLDLVNDPDIDLYIGSWQNSIPFNTHGNLTERAILTSCPGDELKPARKGAVLTAATRFTRANLDPHVSTTPTTLKGEQEIYYIESGRGTLKTGKQSVELREGIFIIVPEGLEFTMANTGDEMLFLYLIAEPVPGGFKPKKEVVVKDEKAMALRDQGYLKSLVKNLVHLYTESVCIEG